jgi:hypothetical protein
MFACSSLTNIYIISNDNKHLNLPPRNDNYISGSTRPTGSGTTPTK